MTKKLLSIQYPPFQGPDFGLINFSQYGFNIFRCDLVGFHNLSEIEKITIRDHGMKLNDFDAILIINADFIPFTEAMLFPEKEIREFKNKLDEIQKGNHKEILFIGFNGSIPESYLQHQSELFDGLFISAATPPDKYQKITEKILSFANTS